MGLDNLQLLKLDCVCPKLNSANTQGLLTKHSKTTPLLWLQSTQIDLIKLRTQVIQKLSELILNQSQGIWTSDVRRAHAVAHALSVGIVWINCWMVRDLRTPFGGMNASGLGREGGDEALRFFSEVQNVCIQL